MNVEQPVQVLKPHIALNVSNLERSLKFYKKLLDLEPSKVRTGYAKFDIVNPPLNLTLNEHLVEGRGALSHLGLQVASTRDVLAIRERWISAGLVTRDEMQTDCCYALQDKAWVSDPDGNQWEVFVVLADDLAKSTSCLCNEDLSVAAAEFAGSQAPAALCCGTAPVEITNESHIKAASCC